MGIEQFIDNEVKANDVVLFMKGTPQFPQCGFSGQVVQILDHLGVARELARTVLPVSLYTQWVWKIDLHNLLHFLELRLDPHAQYEIRVFAEAMAGFVCAWCPWAWEAFEEYRLGAVTFGATERRALALRMYNPTHDAETAAAAVGLKGRELQEFLTKLEIKP